MQLNRKDRLTQAVRSSKANLDRSSSNLPETVDRFKLSSSLDRSSLSPNYQTNRGKINK
jgi:hypothetical protein